MSCPLQVFGYPAAFLPRNYQPTLAWLSLRRSRHRFPNSLALHDLGFRARDEAYAKTAAPASAASAAAAGRATPRRAGACPLHHHCHLRHHQPHHRPRPPASAAPLRAPPSQSARRACVASRSRCPRACVATRSHVRHCACVATRSRCPSVTASAPPLCAPTAPPPPLPPPRCSDWRPPAP
jgi:hypothetical protein